MAATHVRLTTLLCSPIGIRTSTIVPLPGRESDADMTLQEPHAFMNAAQP